MEAYFRLKLFFGFVIQAHLKFSRQCLFQIILNTNPGFKSDRQLSFMLGNVVGATSGVLAIRQILSNGTQILKAILNNYKITVISFVFAIASLIAFIFLGKL